MKCGFQTMFNTKEPDYKKIVHCLDLLLLQSYDDITLLHEKIERMKASTDVYLTFLNKNEKHLSFVIKAINSRFRTYERLYTLNESPQQVVINCKRALNKIKSTKKNNGKLPASDIDKRHNLLSKLAICTTIIRLSSINKRLLSARKRASQRHRKEIETFYIWLLSELPWEQLKEESIHERLGDESIHKYSSEIHNESVVDE